MTMVDDLYYTLVVYSEGYWSIEFGAWDHEIVKEEREEYLSSSEFDLTEKDLVILVTSGGQKTIDEAVRKKNKQEKEKYLKALETYVDETDVDFVKECPICGALQNHSGTCPVAP